MWIRAGCKSSQRPRLPYDISSSTTPIRHELLLFASKCTLALQLNNGHTGLTINPLQAGSGDTPMATESKHAATDSEAIITRVLDATERKDDETIKSFVADDANTVLPMAYSGDAADAMIFPGKAGSMEHVYQVFNSMQKVAFMDRRFTVSADGSVVFVECKGDFISMKGTPYRNIYVFRFDLRDGKIVHWTEYFNPVTIGVSLGVPIGAAAKQH
jgi:ketosteroid isomerase-like protein